MATGKGEGGVQLGGRSIWMMAGDGEKKKKK